MEICGWRPTHREARSFSSPCQPSPVVFRYRSQLVRYFGLYQTESLTSRNFVLRFAHSYSLHNCLFAEGEGRNNYVWHAICSMRFVAATLRPAP
jgi:hypothetical protein